MDNVQKLIEQIHRAAPGLRIVDVIHEQECNQNPCRCQTRAIVLAPEGRTRRGGIKLVRRIVRLRNDAPEPEPFNWPEQIPYSPPAKLPQMPQIVVQPVNPDSGRRKK